jgi:hypothetical protein
MRIASGVKFDTLKCDRAILIFFLHKWFHIYIFVSLESIMALRYREPRIDSASTSPRVSNRFCSDVTSQESILFLYTNAESIRLSCQQLKFVERWRLAYEA